MSEKKAAAAKAASVMVKAVAATFPKSAEELFEQFTAARDAPATKLDFVEDGNHFVVAAEDMQVGREGLLALEQASNSFASVEPAISEDFGAPGIDEVKKNPQVWEDNPYTNAKHAGYAGLRKAIEAMDPAIGIARALIEGAIKSMDSKERAASGWFNVAEMFLDNVQTRVQQAVSYLYRAYKTRVNPNRSQSEPDVPADLIRDVIARLAVMAKSTKQTPANQMTARQWVAILEGCNKIGLERAMELLATEPQPSIATRKDRSAEKAGEVTITKPTAEPANA